MEKSASKQMLSQIQNHLQEMAEPDYQKFSARLLPGVQNILGVRLPKLRKYAHQVWKEYGLFYLDETIHKKIMEESESEQQFDLIEESESEQQFDLIEQSESEQESEAAKQAESMEEILLQGMVLGNLREKLLEKEEISYKQVLGYIRNYVPKINNWSTCDSFCAGLKITKEYPDEMWDFLQEYFSSKRAYDVRFGMVMIINYYIEETRLASLFAVFDEIGANWNQTNFEMEKYEQQDIYYVQMALAWAISICFVHYPLQTMEYLEAMRMQTDVLDDFVYNKALQKIVESHCVSEETKQIIKQMKRKKM